jgi:hypothetical protein
MSWLQLCHILGVKKLLLDFTSDIPMVLNECLDLAMLIVERVEMVGEVDILPYLQDVGSAALSSLGLFLYDVSTSFVETAIADRYTKWFWKMTANQREISVRLLKRMHNRTQTSANGNQEAAATFVARFIERVLTRLNGQSRAVTRAPSPIGLGESDDSGGQDPFFHLVSLNLTRSIRIRLQVRVGELINKGHLLW